MKKSPDLIGKSLKVEKKKKSQIPELDSTPNFLPEETEIFFEIQSLVQSFVTNHALFTSYYRISPYRAELENTVAKILAVRDFSDFFYLFESFEQFLELLEESYSDSKNFNPLEENSQAQGFLLSREDSLGFYPGEYEAFQELYLMLSENELLQVSNEVIQQLRSVAIRSDEEIIDSLEEGQVIFVDKIL